MCFISNYTLRKETSIMKRNRVSVISLLLAVIMIVGAFAACGRGNTTTTEAPGEQSTEATSEQTTKAPDEQTTKAPDEQTTEAIGEQTTKAPDEQTTEATGEQTTNAIGEQTTEDSTNNTTTEETTQATTEESDNSLGNVGYSEDLINISNQLAGDVQAYFENAKWFKYIVENNNMSLKYTVSKDLPQYIDYIKNSQGKTYIENTMDVFVRMTDGHTVYASTSTENAIANMYKLGYYYDEVRFEGQNFRDAFNVISESKIDITKTTYLNNISKPTVNSDGSISFQIRKAEDPFMIFSESLNIDTRQYKYVRVTMKTNSAEKATIFYIANGQTAFNGSQQVSFNVIPDGEYHTYYVKLYDPNTNGGRLTGIRLDIDSGFNVKEDIYLSDISLVEGQEQGIDNLYLANIFHTYSDKLHYEMQLAVTRQVENIAEIGVKTEIDAATVAKLIVEDKNGTHDTLDGVDWASATYVGFDIVEAGIFGLILPVDETTGTITVTLEDGKYVIIYSRAPENNTILPGEGNPEDYVNKVGNENDFYMGYRVYTDETHDFESLKLQAYFERNPLGGKNIKVSTAYSDNGVYEGYDGVRGSYIFSLAYSGIKGLKVYEDYQNRQYNLNFTVKSDSHERLMYIVVLENINYHLECSAILDKNLMMLPIPLEVGKNFFGDGDDDLFDLLDLGYSEVILPIIASPDEIREYNVLHLYENWGDFPLKQISYIEYTNAYYHLSLGTCESNCLVPWGWPNERAIPNMMPDFRGMSGTEWPGSNTHQQSGNHSFLSLGEELTTNYIDSYGPTYVDITMNYLTYDEKIKSTRRHIELPDSDENRTYYVFEYEALEDVTIRNVRDNFNFYKVGSNDTSDLYQMFSYLDENNQSQVLNFADIGGTQVYPLGDNCPYFAAFKRGSVNYGNVAVLVDSYSIVMGGEEQDIPLALRAYPTGGSVALTLDTDKLELKKGDKITIYAILLPWGSEESDYSGTKYAPDQNVLDVRENTLLNPVRVSAVADCTVTENKFIHKLESTNGKSAEFTISGGKKNTIEIPWRHEGHRAAVRIYGFEKLSVPIIYELVNGEWVRYDISSSDNRDKVGYGAYYDGYNVYYDEDGTFSYSFIIDVTEGNERTFKIELDEDFEKFGRIIVEEGSFEEVTPYLHYVNGTGIAGTLWKGWFGRVQMGADAGGDFVSVYPLPESHSYTESVIQKMFKNHDGIVTGQYIVVKYRLPVENANNDKMIFQFFASTEHDETAIQDPNDLFTVRETAGQLIADGQWHLLVIDTSSFNKSSIKANSDGEYKLQYVRFDVFNGLKSPNGQFIDQVDLGYFALHDNLDEILEFHAEDMETITLVTGRSTQEVSTSGN